MVKFYLLYSIHFFSNNLKSQHLTFIFSGSFPLLYNRAVGRALGMDKKTVNKYWNQYKENILNLNETNDSKKKLSNYKKI